MGDLLDRAFQRKLLDELQEVYPHTVNINQRWGDQADNRLLVNLSYLSEYGLVDFTSAKLMSGKILMNSARVTAKGMDFLAADGGIGAILGVVTIKLHDDTIRKLLIQKIEASGAEKGVKISLIAKIKELPAEALGTITQRALDSGLDHLPDLADLLSKWLGP